MGPRILLVEIHHVPAKIRIDLQLPEGLSVGAVRLNDRFKMDGESSLLSLNTAGSSMNAALGGVSAGGMGRPLVDVTQSGGGPSAFVASHPGGNAGGTTLSKFSLHVRGKEHTGQVSALSICAVAGSAATPSNTK